MKPVSPVGERIAEKVKLIFEICRKKDGSRYTLKDVERDSNGTITYTWLWKLYNGQIQSPGMENIALLNSFFGLEPSFWVVSLDEAKTQLVAKMLQTSIGDVQEDVRIIAARASNLPIEARKIVLALIDSLEKSGLRPPEG